MNIDKIFEEEIKKELQEKLKEYENKIFLDNKDIVKELNLSSCSNLRKQIEQGFYDGLYEQKQFKKDRYRWNKFRFLKWIYEQKLNALKSS